MSISTSSDARGHVASTEACVDIEEFLVQALSKVHAAGVCLLDISADSIWVADDGSATFLDFSMAHEFVPGDLSIIACWTSPMLIRSTCHLTCIL